LVLGTAQWGTPYGVTNQKGRLSDRQIAEIVVFAHEVGIRFIDTASGYGDAEIRLAPWSKEFEITSKVHGHAPDEIENEVLAALDRLRLTRLRACLVHDWSTLTEDQSVESLVRLRNLQSRGLIEKIGFSAYDESDLIKGTQSRELIDCIQVPVNVLDQRLLHSPSIKQLKDQGVEVQARSIFLQGLLAARSMAPLGQHPDVKAFHDACELRNVHPLAASLNFVRGLDWVDQVVIGVTSLDEIKEIAMYWESPVRVKEVIPSSADLELVDPRLWNVR